MSVRARLHPLLIIGLLSGAVAAQTPSAPPLLLPPALIAGSVNAAEALEMVSLQLRVEGVMGTDPDWLRSAWDAAVARPDRGAASAALHQTAMRLFAFVDVRLVATTALAPAERARATARLADARRLFAYAEGADSDRAPALTRAFEALSVADPRVGLVPLRGVDADVAAWTSGVLQRIPAPARPSSPGAPAPSRPVDAIYIPPAGGVTDGLGVVWAVVENGLEGTWTRRLGGNTFDAIWAMVNTRAVLEITLVGTRVTISRRQSTDGNDCDYVGQLAGTRVSGTYTCTRFPNPMPWSATISSR